MGGLLWLLLGAGTVSLAVPIEMTSFIEYDSSKEIPVSCPLCLAAMGSFLDFCKEFDGISVPRVSAFVSKCSYIGEDELKEQDRSNGCTHESVILRSRARMWNRKLKCLRIYTLLSEFSSPFDPCTGIRMIVDKVPMAACHSRQMQCTPPPSTDEYDFLPPGSVNMSLPNELPPLRCPQYVSQIDAECKAIKADDFYTRSNLDGFCATKFANNQHQISGCETVRRKMVSFDYMMDLCGSLHAAPITANLTTYCSVSLQLPVREPVPDAGYAAYLERVRLFKEAWMVDQPDRPDRAPIRFPAGDTVVAPPKTNATAEVVVEQEPATPARV